ncbi:hypothetical protein B0H63DRAFT_172379 [Podospora didyma]|uniref:Uncharacterized protein n=1 Tax=Podospora didyma TaxID=330526 RepID=A0AAE0TZ69_9PEZI|nr:hypothetical protein B0H63DRAFT_172379 [Podospora didyma]
MPPQKIFFGVARLHKLRLARLIISPTWPSLFYPDPAVLGRKMKRRHSQAHLVIFLACQIVSTANSLRQLRAASNVFGDGCLRLPAGLVACICQRQVEMKLNLEAAGHPAVSNLIAVALLHHRRPSARKRCCASSSNARQNATKASGYYRTSHLNFPPAATCICALACSSHDETTTSDVLDVAPEPARPSVRLCAKRRPPPPLPLSVLNRCSTEVVSLRRCQPLKQTNTP